MTPARTRSPSTARAKTAATDGSGATKANLYGAGASVDPGASSVGRIGSQTLTLDGFPTPEQVRLLGPNGGMGNRYAVSTCRANVKARVKIEVGRQGIVPMAPPVRVTLRYVFSDARARDEDNFALVGKSVVDGLVKSDILAGDDGERLSERVRFSTERGARRLEIILEPLAATDGEGV